MDNWLDDFAFRISIGTNIYLFAGMISMAIALGAISYHSIRMALSNPVDGLRQE
jgi:putative ABC transport system permease protein